MTLEDLSRLSTDVISTRRQFLKQALAVGVAVPVGGALLAACGEDDDDDGDVEPVDEPDDDDDVEPVDEPEDVDDEEPAEDDDEADEPAEDDDEADEPADAVTFVAAHPGPVHSLDAPVTWFGATHNLAYMMYDCLVYETIEGGEYEGQAAESWEALEDGVTWRFHLREGLTYHNGEPLNADAVKWNIDRVSSDEELMVQPQWAFVDQVEVVDDLTVDVITPQPHAYVLYDISFHGGQLLPPEYHQEVGAEEFARNPVGSGPYQLIEFTDDEQYVFEAWEDYWDGPPDVDRIVIRVIPEQATQVAALLAGDVDFIPGIPEPDRSRIEDADGLSILTQLTNGGIHLYLRDTPEPGNFANEFPDYELATEDVLVRQAISHALDRNLLAEVQGSAVPAVIRMAPWEPAAVAEKYWDEDFITNWYDPELSMELLREAGYDLDAGEGPSIHFDAFTLNYGNESEVAEVVQAMLEDVGFEVSLQILDLSAHREQISEPGNNREIMMAALTTGPSLTPRFEMCDWEVTYRHTCIPEWDEIGEQILAATDEDERVELWDQWWEYYLEDAGTVTLYLVEANQGVNSADFELVQRANGRDIFRHNLTRNA